MLIFKKNIQYIERVLVISASFTKENIFEALIYVDLSVIYM